MKSLFLITILAINSLLAFSQTKPNVYVKTYKSSTAPCVTVLLKAPNAILNTSSPNSIKYRLYAASSFKCNINGVVLLSNYDASLNTTLLNNIAQELANNYFIVAIIEHRGNQGNVQDNNTWVAETNKIDTDYQNVWNELKIKYPTISKNKTVVGGVSFTGFALGSLALNNPWYKDLKGLALIASGCSKYITLPVVNRVCYQDAEVDAEGNNGGQNLQNALQASNPTIATQSTCITESSNVCTGHKDDPSWATFFITKLQNWLH